MHHHDSQQELPFELVALEAALKEVVNAAGMQVRLAGGGVLPAAWRGPSGGMVVGMAHQGPGAGQGRSLSHLNITALSLYSCACAGEGARGGGTARTRCADKEREWLGLRKCILSGVSLRSAAGSAGIP